MTIFDGVLDRLKDEMAKARGQKQAINEELISRYLERLGRTMQRTDLDLLVTELKLDQRLSAADVTTLAQRYNKGGKRPSSKKAALEAIVARFVEIVRFHAKNKVAAKARPW